MKTGTKSLRDSFVEKVKEVWGARGFRSWLLYCVFIPLAVPAVVAFVAQLSGYMIDDWGNNNCYSSLEVVTDSNQSRAIQAKPISLHPLSLMIDLFVVNGVFVFFGADTISSLGEFIPFRKKRKGESVASEKRLTHIDRAREETVEIISIQKKRNWSLNLTIGLVYVISVILFLGNFLLMYKPFVNLIKSNCLLEDIFFMNNECKLGIHLFVLFVAFCAACRIWKDRTDEVNKRECYVR